MTLIITVTHILVSLTLIFVVLLQKGSGADMGAAFGGSSQSVFGARGSGSFLGKMTAALATVFMITSLSLAFFTTQKGSGVSVMEQKQTSPEAGAQTEAVVPEEGVARTEETAIPPADDPPVPEKMAPSPEAPVTPDAIQPIPALPGTAQEQGDGIPSVPKSSP